MFRSNVPAANNIEGGLHVKLSRKWSLAFAGLLAFSMVLSACGKKDNGTNATNEQKTEKEDAKPVEGGTFTWATTADIVTLNPIFINDTGSQNMANLALASVYDVDAKANLVVTPHTLAAELPKISADGLVWTVKLKKEAKWTDGVPVTADDLVYTINATLDPETGSPGISNFDKIKEAKKIDDQTVEITLKETYAPFTYVLTFQPAPYHILKDVKHKELMKFSYGTDITKTPTNGAWKWAKWDQKQSVTMEADANYWGPKPHIKTIVYKQYADQNTQVQALVKGEVDLVEQIPVASLPAVEGKEGVSLVEMAGPVYDYLGFNFKDENFKTGVSPFKGLKTRQALVHALNRQGMVDSVLKKHGTLLNGPFLPGSWADAGTAVNYAYDPAKAKALLAEDGWKDTNNDGIIEKDGKPFEFTVQYNTGNKRRESVAAIIQQNLKDVGIKVNIEPLDFAAWIENNVNPGKFEAVLLGWQLSIDPDAESIFSSKYFPPAGQNSGWYKNTKVDELWVKGWQTPDQAGRKAVYGELAKEISTDLPYVFLFQQNRINGMRDRVAFKDTDKPVLTLPYGAIFHIQDWWVKDGK